MFSISTLFLSLFPLYIHQKFFYSALSFASITAIIYLVIKAINNFNISKQTYTISGLFSRKTENIILIISLVIFSSLFVSALFVYFFTKLFSSIYFLLALSAFSSLFFIYSLARINFVVKKSVSFFKEELSEEEKKILFYKLILFSIFSLIVLIHISYYSKIFLSDFPNLDMSFSIEFNFMPIAIISFICLLTLIVADGIKIIRKYKLSIKEKILLSFCIIFIGFFLIYGTLEIFIRFYSLFTMLHCVYYMWNVTAEGFFIFTSTFDLELGMYSYILLTFIINRLYFSNVKKDTI
jgi:hypothetical protein